MNSNKLKIFLLSFIVGIFKDFEPREAIQINLLVWELF